MTSRVIHDVAQSYGLSTGPFLVLCLGLIFLAGGLLFICGVFVSRISKSHYQKKTHLLLSAYQKVLNKIVVNETFSEEGAPDAAFEYYLAELRLISGDSRFSRQVLLGRILEMKKSLTGNSARALVKTYYALFLYRESLKKLKSFRWKNIALAIREVAEMKYSPSIRVVERFLYSRNRTLQEESLMALVRLEDEPLAFLNNYTGELSPWMRINIYRYLQNIDYRRLPIFSRYFNHPNLSVRIFAISMARSFKQSSSVAGFADLLYSENAKVVGLAVSAVGAMEAFQYREDIAKLAMHVWRFHKLSQRVVQCLGRIGDQDADVELVGQFLVHPNYNVRFEAVSALKKLGVRGEEFLQRLNISHHRKVESILRHFSEPLLN